MTKLTLNHAPTFKAKALIPVAGGEPAELELEYKGRGRQAYADFVAKIQVNEAAALDGDLEATEAAQVDVFLDCVTGWELEDEMTRENVALFLDSYPQALVVVLKTYYDEIWNARSGN